MDRPVAVITGAAHGIGLETAKRLSATHRIALLDLDGDALPGAAAQCGDDALHRSCDITSADQVAEAVAYVVEEAGGIDVLISNAGLAIQGALRQIDPDALAACLNVNLVGNWRVIHACLPHIEARRGYVMGVASASAIAPAVHLGPYGTSKAGFEMLLDILRVEVAHLGVDVGCAYFLWIATDMVEGADREVASFAAMREGMAAPLRTTYPVSDAAQAIVDGVHKRSRAVYAPKWLRILSPMRMILRTRLGERDARKMAPDLDRLTAQRVAEAGTFDAALRRTPASEAAAESAGHHLRELA